MTPASAASAALQSGVTPDPTPLPDPPLPYWGVLEPVTEPLLVFVAVYVVGRFLAEPSVERVVRRRNPNNRSVRETAERYVRAAIALVALGAAVSAAGYGDLLTRSSVLLAAVTLAVGVAGQEVIGNVVSGLFLVADGEFNVGDWIAWGEREGVVEVVGFRVTRVRTPDNETVTVPNTELATDVVIRPYSRSRYRVSDEFEVAVDDVETATALLREVIGERQEVLASPSPSVRLAGFENGAVLRTQYWVSDPSRRTVDDARDAVARAAVDRLLAAGVTLSPPSGQELSGAVGVRRSER